MKNILEMLERSAERFPEKTAFSDGESSVTYSRLGSLSRLIGSKIAALGYKNRPVAVCIDKSAECVASMLGAVYGGNFYVVIDVEMPLARAKEIFSTLKPVAFISLDGDDRFLSLAGDGCVRLIYEELIEGEENRERLAAVRASAIDTDPVYALFTSGSTGVPKGAVLSHRSVISYARWVTETFDINSDTVFGNQTPFYFSMSVLDIYSALMNSATLFMIPKKLFSFPLKLIEFLNDHRVNTVYWVPSALCLVANWKALDYMKPEYLEKILFAGEVMPAKQLNVWINHLPKALYANLYGPTEVTDICAYYVVNRKFDDTDTLPIGAACNNCGLLVLDENGREAEQGAEGELCVRGSFLASGYYNNPEKTAEVFVQNPLNPYYPELIYKTGDIVRYNSYGELEYIGRRDFQIKRMGYRIELGEIEAAAGAISEFRSVCCVYNPEKDSITLVYEGKNVDDKYIMDRLRELLPAYMEPDKIVRVKSMPFNRNGKIDRKSLMSDIEKFM